MSEVLCTLIHSNPKTKVNDMEKYQKEFYTWAQGNLGRVGSCVLLRKQILTIILILTVLTLCLKHHHSAFTFILILGRILKSGHIMWGGGHKTCALNLTVSEISEQWVENAMRIVCIVCSLWERLCIYICTRDVTFKHLDVKTTGKSLIV